MQNLSILQLLKTLSAVSAAESAAPQSPPSVKTEEKSNVSDLKNSAIQNENSAVPPTHAREETDAAYAYERFLARHDQAVRRVQDKTDRP